MSVLAGRRVLVTRSRQQAAELCALLAARGARPLVFPTIAIEPQTDAATAAAVAALGSYDWIAFTSANAVTYFWERLRAAGRDRPPARVSLAAVGEATAEALAARGARVAAVPQAETGAALAGALGALAGRRVLLPRSSIARADTPAALRAAGAEVTELVLYRTVPARPTPGERRLLEQRVDAVTFTSPSTVRGLVAAGGAAAERLLPRTVLACIGPTTAAAVRALGLTVAVQPVHHTAAALVGALEAYFATPTAGSAR